MRNTNWVNCLAAGFISVLVALNAGAAPITFDFSQGTKGDLGTASVTFDVDEVLLEVHGFWLDAGIWKDANLYRRRDSDDNGLGICNPMELDERACELPLDTGGDINELDNAGQAELIRLALPAGFRWDEVGVSSLDNNDGGPLERGQLFADDGDPNNGLGALVLQFAGGGPVEPDFAIPAAFQFSPYLFFRPFDWSPGAENDNNDYLVRSAVIDRRQETPEPASLTLMAAGLALLGLAGRRRFRS